MLLQSGVLSIVNYKVKMLASSEKDWRHSMSLSSLLQCFISFDLRVPVILCPAVSLSHYPLALLSLHILGMFSLSVSYRVVLLDDTLIHIFAFSSQQILK